MTAPAFHLAPAFPDPVHDSQACFRAVLDAMARPGTIHGVHAPAAPPAPLDLATAALLLTLVDPETPLWLDDAALPAAPWIDFHCGAPRAPAGTARFALALTPPAFPQFDHGTDDEPEAGVTLILQLAALGTGRAYRLEGPGHPAPTRFQADGLPDSFEADWTRAQANFPRGLDLILTAGTRLLALPRTQRIGATS